MSILTIDGHILRKAIIEGSNYLNKNKNIINDLNVFPVPDGDTGINMSMTVLSAAKEVYKLNTPNVYDIAKAASSGALRGARGNSGVILSQLFRGFAKALETKLVINAEDISYAFLKAIEMAYKAVMKPKEGTILTVAKSISDFSLSYNFNEKIDIKNMLKDIIAKGNETLKETKYMLPELKQAGVVDAGAKGLLYILQGALDSLDIKDDIKIDELEQYNKNTQFSSSNIQNVDIKFIYCTEFFINIKDKSKNIESIEEEIKFYLQKKGDSIVIVSDNDTIKIHLHTNHPGEVLERAIKFGEIENIKIENMKIQHTNIISFVEETKEIYNLKEQPKEIGFISISSGRGLKTIFKDLGVDIVLEGGQTMNPSIDNILNAIESINSKNIIILPNNSNVILAANQSAKICKDKNVHVIPTKSIAEGISALANSIENEGNLEEIVSNMKEYIKNVKTGQVTFAVRDTNIDSLKIKKDDIISILDNKIIGVSDNIEKCTKKLIDTIIKYTENIEILSIYYGNGITKDDIKIIEDYIKTNYEDIEFEIYEGSQPLYYYIISVE